MALYEYDNQIDQPEPTFFHALDEISGSLLPPEMQYSMELEILGKQCAVASSLLRDALTLGDEPLYESFAKPSVNLPLAAEKIARVITDRNLASAIWSTNPMAIPPEFRERNDDMTDGRMGLTCYNEGDHSAFLNIAIDAKDVRPVVAVAAIVRLLHERLSNDEFPKPKRHVRALDHFQIPVLATRVLTPGFLPDHAFVLPPDETVAPELKECPFVKTDKSNVFRVPIHDTQLSIEFTLHPDFTHKTHHLSPTMHRGSYELAIIVADTPNHDFQQQQAAIEGAQTI